MESAVLLDLFAELTGDGVREPGFQRFVDEGANLDGIGTRGSSIHRPEFVTCAAGERQTGAAEEKELEDRAFTWLAAVQFVF